MLSRDEKIYLRVVELQNITRAPNKHKKSIDLHLIRICLCCSLLGLVQLWIWEPVLPTEQGRHNSSWCCRSTRILTVVPLTHFLYPRVNTVWGVIMKVWASVMIRMWWSSQLQPCKWAELQWWIRFSSKLGTIFENAAFPLHLGSKLPVQITRPCAVQEMIWMESLGLGCAVL